MYIINIYNVGVDGSSETRRKPRRSTYCWSRSRPSVQS